jgi:pSer/pThr/pTyr-binding forkhead associated (FHA) protein
MICGQCQADNPSGNAFCHACGNPLGGQVAAPPSPTQGKLCPRCGALNGAHVQYCNGCGTPLGAQQPAPPPPPAQRPVVAGRPAALPHNCPRCGGLTDPGSRFCKFCGAPMDAQAAPAAAPYAAPAAAAYAAPAAAYAAPAAPLSAQVVVILRDGSEGGVYPLAGERTDIGSREGDVVLRDDPYLSPRHARIERRGDTFVLSDLGSVNGIYIRLREPTDLVDGDMILIGQQVLRFELLSEAERQIGPAMQHGVMVFGTPETPRMARMVQYTTEGLGRDVYYLHRDETVLGREQADLVFAEDPFLSRRHAAVAVQRDQRRYTLRDLGSSNGTAIRCRRERALQAGDQFRLGRHLFRFDLTSGGRGGRNPQ